jgi:hypothetical protein
MSDYILTTRETKSFHGFERVRSVKDITKLTKKSYLIIESYDDKDFELALFLINSVMSLGIHQVAYVTDNPVQIIDELMKSINAYRAHLPESIETPENISALMRAMVDEDKSDDQETLVENLEVLTDFVNSKVEGEPKVKRRLITSSLQTIVSALDDTVFSDRLRRQIQDMIVSFIMNTNNLQREISKLEKEIVNLKASTMSGANGISSFQQYTYVGNARVLLIKEHTPTRYLTSFLISFINYLSDVASVKSKLIIIDNNNDNLDIRYEGIKKADFETIRKEVATLTLSPVVYTATPNKSVLDTLFESVGVELFVVLDRTQKSINAVTGRSIKVANAVSSKSKMRKLNLNANETIVNDQADVSQLGMISLVESYPKMEDARILTLQQAFSNVMKNLAEYSGVKI